MNDTEGRVTTILVEHLGVTPDQVVLDARLCPPTGEPHQPGEAHLGCDSLDIVELIMAVEEEFGIVIPDDESDHLDEGTVRDLVALVDAKRTAEAA